jgi:hypothetical protein
MLSTQVTSLTGWLEVLECNMSNNYLYKRYRFGSLSIKMQIFLVQERVLMPVAC